MKKILFTLTMLIATLSLHAHDFEVDGIFYNCTSDTTVEVTYDEDSWFIEGEVKGYSYRGEVIIPDTVVYSGNTYRVTSINSDAFDYCRDVTKIAIPNSMVQIKANF